MSCMIQKPENTAAIAGFIGELLNMGYEVHGMTAPRELYEVLEKLGCSDTCNFFSDSKIYEQLATLNATAYNGRYNSTTKTFSYFENKITEFPSYVNGHFSVMDWHFKMLKMVQFFNYQCTEDATVSHPLYKAMKKLENSLFRFIVENSENYRAVSWE